jgi:cellulose synthase/poly-beta-1,6-N-acetylglucosamine synthase-like glycosyltransferase
MLILEFRINLRYLTFIIYTIKFCNEGVLYVAFLLSLGISLSSSFPSIDSSWVESVFIIVVVRLRVTDYFFGLSNPRISI